jgi:hypothetical protein
LFCNWVIAIVPPSNRFRTEDEEILEAIPVLADWARGVLVGLALGVMLVFGIALWLDPYQEDVVERRMGTHQQLGLPPCTFVTVTGYPCPACGMTTSFALLVRGDVLNSLRANWVGTLLAGLCLLFIPWSLVSVWKRRTVFVRSVERTFTILVVGFMVLLLLRWGIVIGLLLSRGSGTP